MFESPFTTYPMITKEQLSAGMTKECDVAIHLFGKLLPDSYEYQPGPKQRTTTELLRYLSLCGIAGIQAMEKSDFKLFGEIMKANGAMPPQEFPREMQKQKEQIEEYFQSVTEEHLESSETSLPGTGTVPLGFALMSGPLKWLASYKLLLFNYAKAAGAHGIGTANAWGGIDWPPPSK